MSYSNANDQVLFTSKSTQVETVSFVVEVISYKGSAPKMRAMSTSRMGTRQCARFTAAQFEAVVPLFAEAQAWLKDNPHSVEETSQKTIEELRKQLAELQSKVATANVA